MHGRRLRDLAAMPEADRRWAPRPDPFQAISRRGLPVALVGAGLPDLQVRLIAAKPYADRLFQYRELGRLSDAAARAGLVGPAATLGVEYEEKAARQVVRESAGYPYFIQEYGLEHVLALPDAEEALLANGPRDVELDVPGELGAELSLEDQQRDSVVAWVPGPRPLPEDSAERVDRRLPERDPVALRRDAEPQRQFNRPAARRGFMAADGGGQRRFPFGPFRRGRKPRRAMRWLALPVEAHVGRACDREERSVARATARRPDERERLTAAERLNDRGEEVVEVAAGGDIGSTGDVKAKRERRLERGERGRGQRPYRVAVLAKADLGRVLSPLPALKQRRKRKVSLELPTRR